MKRLSITSFTQDSLSTHRRETWSLEEMMLQRILEERLIAAFPEATIQIRDLTGGGDHFHVTIISDIFQGKALVQRHRLVYSCLKDELRERIHALSLNPMTLEEAEQKGLIAP